LIAIQGYDYPGQLSVVDAIRDLGIDYPVAHDDTKATWRLYGIQFRPAHALIGPDGSIVGQGTGLVTTPEVQRQIESLLAR
jgi:hypothetical protein